MSPVSTSYAGSAGPAFGPAGVVPAAVRALVLSVLHSGLSLWEHFSKAKLLATEARRRSAEVSAHEAVASAEARATVARHELAEALYRTTLGGLDQEPTAGPSARSEYDAGANAPHAITPLETEDSGHRAAA
jgi:hypothetical protein